MEKHLFLLPKNIKEENSYNLIKFHTPNVNITDFDEINYKIIKEKYYDQVKKI